MTLQLTLTTTSHVPIEVEGITPDAVSSLTTDEIEALPIFHGNEQVRLGDRFAVSGDPGDEVIEFLGDCCGVHWIGAKMQRGEIRVAGSAGRHVGSEMTGGRIDVAGDAGDWVGGEMHGGAIRVHGSAGHLVGAADRGSARGMTRGTIIVDGNAGNEIGHTMRRGLIAIGGRAGDLAGFNMLAGSILLFDDTGIRHGAGMRRGTIAILGNHAASMLPTFRFACQYRPIALLLLLRELDALGFPVPESMWDSSFDLYNGDLLEHGRGEIIIRPHPDAPA